MTTALQLVLWLAVPLIWSGVSSLFSCLGNTGCTAGTLSLCKISQEINKNDTIEQ